MIRSKLLLSVMAMSSGLSACSKENADAGAAVEPLPSREAPRALSSAAPSASAPKDPVPPSAPPTMKLVAMGLPELTEFASLDTIDGAVMVVMKNRVARLLPEGGLEWLAEIPRGSPVLGDNIINGVSGEWPEEVAILYSSSHSRAPQPQYHSIRGGGGDYIFGEGGSGWVAGVARSGETTTVAGFDFIDGYRIASVRGPMVKPAFLPQEKAGCEPSEAANPALIPPAVLPVQYGATRAGTIISVGKHCKDGRPAAEIWRKPTAASEIVDLKKWYEHGNAYATSFLRGRGDTLYVLSDRDNAILRYRDGQWNPLPKFDRQRRDAFVSPDGDLYAGDGRNMFELVGDGWEKRFELTWPTFMGIARVGDTFIVSVSGKLYRLEPTPSITLDPQAASVDCKTPFVHWFDVLPQTVKGHAFPDTAKRLSDFAQPGKIKLVEFEQYGRRIGIIADDWDTAKAVLKHIQATATTEDPRLICFAPVEPRVLEIKTASQQRP